MMICKHEESVFWNPKYKVVKCHKCGQVFEPAEEEPLRKRQKLELLLGRNMCRQVAPIDKPKFVVDMANEIEMIYKEAL